MKIKNFKYNVYLVALLACFSCKKPYMPIIAASANNYLVIEGFVNTGNESTVITLSRTVNLSESIKIKPEPGAAVTVEGNGSVYQLYEINAGVYSAPPLNLDATQKYHLRIRLNDGKEYVSDDAEVKVTPPVDTVTYEAKSNGLQINASTHDPSNKTRYYRWDFDETWKFHSRYISNYKVQGTEVVPRPSEEQIFTCFGNYKSSTVVLASTAKLSQDVVSNAPIALIQPNSEKISVRYSILVKQYAITQEAFTFWENLRKNTESLGSIFDALPSEIKGNIHNVSDAAEPVIGFVSFGTVTSKRIFIDKESLPKEWALQYPYECKQDSLLYRNPVSGTNDVAAYIISGAYLPTFPITGPKGGPAIGYGGASRECVDCTLRGTTMRPDFWKD